MNHFWKAEVTVSGVPVVTDEECESVMASLPGAGILSRRSGTDEIVLTWRFANASPDIWDAVEQVSARWRGAVGHIESAVDPVCTDFHVLRVQEL